MSIPAPDEISIEDPLCNSSLGSMVTLAYVTFLTWRGMSKNAKLREKHKWAIDKPKLDNARRLRGIYFIDPEDLEFKEIIEKSKKKIGNTNGSIYALQNLQEKQAWRDPLQD